eukprot:m.233634 g.233634  ORF g.233634 m.233634 type:complete len:129 (-) comp18905_c1_seq1:417-803(-)
MAATSAPTAVSAPSVAVVKDEMVVGWPAVCEGFFVTPPAATLDSAAAAPCDELAEAVARAMDEGRGNGCRPARAVANGLPGDTTAAPPLDDVGSLGPLGMLCGTDTPQGTDTQLLGVEGRVVVWYNWR